jgi:succinate dehydrogenase / fumarate reductase, membrane anchor subunit
MSRNLIFKESQIMKVHYITGLAALFVVAVHILMRLVVVPYGSSLEYHNVIINYQNIFYAALLEVILVLVSIHGFNGIRIILIELRQGARWENSITVATIVAMMVLIFYGTRTIIIANGLGT